LPIHVLSPRKKVVALAVPVGEMVARVPSPRFALALAALAAPVPPCEIDSGVAKDDSEVISEFEPLEAAPRLLLAVEAFPAPVPPFAMATVPETFTAVVAFATVPVILLPATVLMFASVTHPTHNADSKSADFADNVRIEYGEDVICWRESSR